MKKKEKKLKHRLPEGVVLFLRSHGGVQSSKKGDKGYSRQTNKKVLLNSKKVQQHNFYLG